MWRPVGLPHEPHRYRYLVASEREQVGRFSPGRRDNCRGISFIPCRATRGRNVHALPQIGDDNLLRELGGIAVGRGIADLEQHGKILQTSGRCRSLLIRIRCTYDAPPSGR